MRGLARDAGALRAHARRHRPQQQLPRGRARARAPGDPAGVHRGRGRRAVDRRTSCSTGSRFGSHPIGAAGDRQRAQHRAASARADLLDYVARQYTGANVVVGVAGRDRSRRRSSPRPRRRSARMPRGRARTRSRRRRYVGGVALARPAGLQPDARRPRLSDRVAGARTTTPASVAAALFGEGMSSPLMDEIRERRGLVYYASCSADVNELCGQFVIEASTAPEQLDEFLVEVRAPARCAGRARSTPPTSSARSTRSRCARCARRSGRAPARGRRARPVRARPRALARRGAGARRGGRRARRCAPSFARMLATPAALAIAGRVKKGASERARELFA